MTPRFFATRTELRAWFKAHAARESEIWIAYYKRGSGRTSISYEEAVEEALCVGWIDGQVRRIDDASYMNRYTPRGPRSIWSLANVARVRRLIREGRMRPTGIAAFRARTRARTGVYRFEGPPRAPPKFDVPTERAFRTHRAAFEFFLAQPPGYRSTLIRWIMDARTLATRARRLDAVIVASSAGRRVDPVHPYENRSG